MDNMLPSLGFDAGRSSLNRPRLSSDPGQLNSLTGRLTTSQSLSGDLFEQILSMPAQPARDSADDSLVETNDSVDQSGPADYTESDSVPINSESQEDTDNDSELEPETPPDLLAVTLASQPVGESHEDQQDTDTGSLAGNQAVATADAQKQSDEDALPGEAESLAPQAAEEFVESQQVAPESVADSLDSKASPQEVLANAEAPDAQAALKSVEQKPEVVADEAAVEEQPFDYAEQEADDPEVESRRSSDQDDSRLTEPTSSGSSVEKPESDGESPTHRSERREKWYEARSVGAVTSSSEGDPTQQDTPEFNQDETRAQSLQAETAQLQTIPEDLVVDGTNAPAAMGPTETTGLPPAAASSSSLVGVQLEFGLETNPVNEQSSLASGGTDASRASLRTGRSVVSRGDGHSEQTADLTQAERVRLVQRVSRSFARLGPSGGSISIKLHPPQLGALNVQVRLEGRSMTAKLTTETSAARDAILESLPVLRGRLAEQGFEISQFQVEVADNQTDAASSGNQQQLGQSGSDSGGTTNRSVDQRRVSLRQRQQLEGTHATATQTRPRELTWQTMAGIDLQA